MRILISADMEGVTGVTSTDDVIAGTEPWQRFRRLFTGDVNACVEGLHDAGATDVVINEAHATQRNLLLEDLDPRARMLTGRQKPLSMMQGIDEDVDGVVFLGYHTGAGAEGVLSHTYMEGSVIGVWLDGVHAGEGRLNAALAAEHGVPVLLVTGDDLTCLDAADYAPAAETVAVKECVSRHAALCQSPTHTAADIRAGAARGVAVAGRSGGRATSHRVEIEFAAANLAAAAAVIPTVERVGSRGVSFEAATMTEAMKAFKVVTIVASRAIEGVYG
ncbi:M55 family metallopeptidase [Halosaccharopolyspora lacisalsi]|uniref:M55 family metallopeptidase n=1 Tax=Halosaccharopolyspora lacisalsi TaxID=1000566 RepID=UPI0015F8A1D2|nr:M55 family metallopeptidase [Halosaccharopolyspora lacisalsi]